jgi:hypothetical protein
MGAPRGRSSIRLYAGRVSAHPFVSSYVVVGTALGAYVLTSGDELNSYGSVWFFIGLPMTVFVPLAWFLTLSLVDWLLGGMGVAESSQGSIGAFLALVIALTAYSANAFLWLGLMKVLKMGRVRHCSRLTDSEARFRVRGSGP